MLDDKNYNPTLDSFDEGFTLIEFMNYLKKNFLILFGFVFVTLAIGVFYTWFLVTPMYTSRTSISFDIVESPNLTQTYTSLRNILPIQEEIIKSERFLEKVKEGSQIKSSIEQMQRSLSVSVIGDRLQINITAKHANPEEAFLITSSIADYAIRAIDYSQPELNIIVDTFQLHLPKLPKAPSSPNKMLNLIISIMVGGILGVIVILLKEQFSNRFSSVDEIEKFTGYPVIGEIFDQGKAKKGE